MKTRKITIWIIIFGILIIAFLLYKINKSSELNILNTIGIIGSIASIGGITITYIQLLSVKKESEITNKAIKDTLNELYKSFSISDLSKTIKLTNETQSLIRANKPESALLRMQDLKNILIQIKHIDILNSKFDTNEYKEILLNLNIDMSNINALLISKKSGINFQKVYSNLEVIVTFLSELETKLKYQ